VDDSSGCTGCEPVPDAPGRWLFRGGECEVFPDWFDINFECCDRCVDELADFEGKC